MEISWIGAQEPFKPEGNDLIVDTLPPVLGLGVVAVSPVDLAAFTEEAGIPYPTNPAAKAQLLPLVAQWKNEKAQQVIAAQAESTVPQGINPLLVGAGAAGLAGLGIAAWPHLQKLGQTPAAASDQAVADAVAANTQGPAIPYPPNQQTANAPAGTRVVRKTNEKPGDRLQHLRNGNLIDNGALMGASRLGTLQSRSRDEYSLKSIWQDPVLGPQMAAADTPELQQALVDRLSVEKPDVAVKVAQAIADRSSRFADIQTVKTFGDLPKKAADGTVYRIQDTNETVVYNNSGRGEKWQSASAAGVRKRMAETGRDAYGSVTMEESLQQAMAKPGVSAMAQTRRTSGGMFQPGYDPDRVFVDDNGNVMGDRDNGTYYLGNSRHRELAEKALLQQRTEAVQAQRKQDGLPPANGQELIELVRAAGGVRIRDVNTGLVDGGVSGDAARYHTAWEETQPGSGIYKVDKDGNLVPRLISPSVSVTRMINGEPTEVVLKPKGVSDEEWTRPRSAMTMEPDVGNVRLDNVLADKEDALNKGLMEPLPASRASRQGASGFIGEPVHFVDEQRGEVVTPVPQFTGKTRRVQGNDGKVVEVREAVPSVYEGIYVETPVTQFVPNGKTETRWDATKEAYVQVPLGQQELVLDGSGNIQYNRRLATPQDLVAYTENTEYDAPPYRGKTASEAVFAMQAPNYNYSNENFQQNPYILKEPRDSYGRALAAAAELTASGLPPAEIYSRYGVDQPMVDRAQAFQNGELSSAVQRATELEGAHAVGGHTHKDWLTQVLSSLAVQPRDDAWQLSQLEQSGTREDSAELARNWLNANPGIAEVLSSNLGDVPVVEQLNIVQEALGDAAADFPKAVAWAQQNNPELAERARLGGEGSFGFDQFSKTYVRKAVIGSVAALKNEGGAAASSITLPADVGELLALEARAMNPSDPRIEVAINQRIGGTTSPIEAVWKLDGILSDVAETRLNDPNANGSRLAEQFFKAAQPGDGSRVGGMKSRYGARTDASYDALRAPSPGEEVASRMPIAIKFGSKAGIDGGSWNRDDLAPAADAIQQAVHKSGLTVSSDPSLIDPSLPKSGSSKSVLAAKTGGKGRAFAVNKILDNEAKVLQGQIYDLTKSKRNGDLSDAEFKTAVAGLKAQIQSLVGRQRTLDATRAGNETLLLESNYQARTNAGREGRGYVLDLASNGVVRALPDIGSNTVSYEQVFEKPSMGQEEGSYDAEVLAQSARDAGQGGERQLDDLEPVTAEVGSDYHRAIRQAEREGSMTDVEAYTPRKRIREWVAERAMQAGAPAAETRYVSGQSPVAPPVLDRSRQSESSEEMLQRLALSGQMPSAEQTAARVLQPVPQSTAGSASAKSYRVMADTLAASRQQAPVITDRERQVATTGHYADYMDKLYSQGLTKNAQPKQVGNNRMGAYVAPSDAAIAGRVNFLRKRGIL